MILTFGQKLCENLITQSNKKAVPILELLLFYKAI